MASSCLPAPVPTVGPGLLETLGNMELRVVELVTYWEKGLGTCFWQWNKKAFRILYLLKSNTSFSSRLNVDQTMCFLTLVKRSDSSFPFTILFFPNIFFRISLPCKLNMLVNSDDFIAEINNRRKEAELVFFLLILHPSLLGSRIGVVTVPLGLTAEKRLLCWLAVSETRRGDAP